MSVFIISQDNAKVNREVENESITGNALGRSGGTFTKVLPVVGIRGENGVSGCSPREIYAKSSSPCTNILSCKARFERAERYRLQSIARYLFIEEGKKDSSLKYAQNFHLTAKCLVTRFKKNVDVCQDKRLKAYYGNLIHCGSVWSCPVCAPIIQERRRLEICQTMDWAYKQKDDSGKLKYQCVMVTLTFPHYAFDTCHELLDKQAKALKYLRSGKLWDNFKKQIGFLGLIRALEVLFGDENGWHPHTHEVWIIDSNCDIESLKRFVIDRWAKACKKVGLLPDNRTRAFDERAVHIEKADSSSYLAKQNKDFKWGADKELAMPDRKTEKAGKSPFDLLADYSKGNAVAGRLFVEYSLAFKGRRQLLWSPGLKELVGLEDIIDEQVVAEQAGKADILASLLPAQWDLILEKKARAVILDIAEQEGVNGIKRWFDEDGS